MSASTTPRPCSSMRSSNVRCTDLCRVPAGASSSSHGLAWMKVKVNRIGNRAEWARAGGDLGVRGAWALVRFLVRHPLESAARSNSTLLRCDRGRTHSHATARPQASARPPATVAQAVAALSIGAEAYSPAASTLAVNQALAKAYCRYAKEAGASTACVPTAVTARVHNHATPVALLAWSSLPPHAPLYLLRTLTGEPRFLDRAPVNLEARARLGTALNWKREGKEG